MHEIALPSKTPDDCVHAGGVTDGDTTAHGPDTVFPFFGFAVDQPLEEAVTVKVTAKPTASDRAPVWV